MLGRNRISVNPENDMDYDHPTLGYQHNTIIVGGGVAGLACAHRLAQSGETNFLLLSENLGGRIMTSTDHQVNYGAFYVRSDYENLKPFVKLNRTIRTQDISVFYLNEWRTLLDFRNWKHICSLLRFLWFLRKFRLRYTKFRRACEQTSQKCALSRDPWLEAQFKRPAAETIKQLGIQFWTRRFLESLVRSTAFVDIQQISTCHFAMCCLPITTPTYEFEFQLQQLTEPFHRAIRKTKVVRTSRINDVWRVETDSAGCFLAHNLVLATPLSVTKQLITIDEPTNPLVAVYLVHLRGQLRPEYKGHEFYILPREGDDIVLVHEPNGTVLLYSHCPLPRAELYFESFEVIARHHWDPAFFIGTEILESDRGDGLFLIGDHSICSLEDAFITGLFAANRILTKQQHTTVSRR